MDQKHKILFISFITSLGFLCYFKPKFDGDNDEMKIPEIKDPHLFLQFGGPKDKKII